MSGCKSIKELTDEYIDRGNNKMSTTEPITPNVPSKELPVSLPDIPTSWERFAVMTIFGCMTLYMGYQGNTEAMTGFATTLSMYFLARNGA